MKDTGESETCRSCTNDGNSGVRGGHLVGGYEEASMCRFLLKIVVERRCCYCKVRRNAQLIYFSDLPRSWIRTSPTQPRTHPELLDICYAARCRVLDIKFVSLSLLRC